MNGVDQAIEFGMWLTGHDENTVSQMYRDYKTHPKRSEAATEFREAFIAGFLAAADDTNAVDNSEDTNRIHATYDFNEWVAKETKVGKENT